MKRVFLSFTILALFCIQLNAQTIQANQFMTWGIGSDQIKIPTGSVVTEAVLTIAGVSSSNTGFAVHLLDDVSKGFAVGIDDSGQNYFASCGAVLKGSFVSGNYVCKFSLNDDPASLVWGTFPNPFTVRMADSTSVKMTSSLLTLLDYAGNGKGFGLGLDPGTIGFSFKSMSLVLTIRTYQGRASTSKVTYNLTFKSGV